MNTQTGIVTFFDRLSGDGVVLLNSGIETDISACDIPGKKTWLPNTACVYYDINQEIELKWDNTLDIWRCLTQGILDHKKWCSLQKKSGRLALECTETGKLVHQLVLDSRRQIEIAKELVQRGLELQQQSQLKINELRIIMKKKK